jgi:hypothetical protein
MKNLAILGGFAALVIGGMTLVGNTEEATNNVEVPVIELTTEQKFEEARNQMLKEIETLEAEKAAIEEKITAKKELIK